jgi:ATP-binding cassette subfamily F protein 3
LLAACADRLWIVSDGTVKSFDGDLDDYRRRVLSDRSGGNGKVRTTRTPKPALIPGDRSATADKRSAAKPLRQRVSQAEAEVSRLSREIEKLDAALADGNLFARDPAQAAALAKARAISAAALAQAEDDWLTAGAELQAATG